MSNIPTAEEFAKTHHPMKTYPVDHQMMIEFAKLHVEAALKQAHSNTYLPTSDLQYTLASYPLTNIK